MGTRILLEELSHLASRMSVSSALDTSQVLSVGQFPVDAQGKGSQPSDACWGLNESDLLRMK
jgi:hypothetical protein